MWQLVFLTLSWDLVPAAAHSLHRGMDGVGRRQYQVQHGACSYTFLLPETDGCRPPASSYVSNAVQRDAPLDYDDSVQRLQVLEGIMENNTQWLMKVGPGRGRGPGQGARGGGRAREAGFGVPGGEAAAGGGFSEESRLHRASSAGGRVSAAEAAAGGSAGAELGAPSSWQPCPARPPRTRARKAVTILLIAGTWRMRKVLYQFPEFIY